MAAEALENILPEIISLDRSRAARAFHERESLWKYELSRMFQFLERQLDTLKEAERSRLSRGDELYAPQVHRPESGRSPDPHGVLSIAIFGAYGSGKSSLLRTFCQEAHSRRRQKGMGVFALPVIEPKHISSGNHFLYDFLAAALETESTTRYRRAGEARFGESDQDQILSPVEQVFREVSEYLQVIDEPQPRSQEYDPLGVSLERLERNTSGLRLREKMRLFIDELANSLAGPGRTSMVLLPVDDADMSFKVLNTVLDTYHRYLMHPRLVPVFTFTGRLAEELLATHFRNELVLGEAATEAGHLMEAATSLTVHENLAVQHLSKLFPVRNRIRLGPAPSRVQASRFHVEALPEGTTSEELKLAGTSVKGLLQVASRLLFGCAEWPEVPSIRLPLRPSTLRRQIQVLDALDASHASQYLTPADEAGSAAQAEQDSTAQALAAPSLPTTPHSWAVVFDWTAWSLLNVHRDVLKELQLNLEDLYTWTRGSLRQVVLEGILSQPLEDRRKMLKRWRYKNEDRRSQMLSLLAANVFRPWMVGEEPTGDEPDFIDRAYRTESPEKLKQSFSVRKGFIWFANLWIGFYLPQIMARNRSRESTHPDIGEVQGVGWGLCSGPAHAMREALANETIFSTGMLLIDVKDLHRVVNDLHNRAEKDRSQVEPFNKLRLLGRIWFFLGYDRGVRWSAVSLWRGMGLAAQLLLDGVRFHAVKHHLPVPYIKSLIRRHCLEATIAGAPSRRTARLPKDRKGKIRFHAWTGEGEEDKVVEQLAGCLLNWIELFDPKEFRIYPLLSRSIRDVKSSCNHSCPGGFNESAALPLGLQMWKYCHIRLLHGDSLLSEFWGVLQTAYFDHPTEDWTASEILQKWIKILVSYFPPESYLSLLIMTCPFIRPFLSDAEERINKIVEDHATAHGENDEQRQSLRQNLHERIEACNFVPKSDSTLPKMLERFNEMKRAPWPESPFYDETLGGEPAPES